MLPQFEKGAGLVREIISEDGSVTTHKRSFVRGIKNWVWPMLADLPREALRAKVARVAIGAPRFVWYGILLRRMRTLEGSGGTAKSTIRHNIRGMLDLHVERSIRLIYPIAMWAAARRISLSTQKVLTIGPRTEGEIYNLIAHGFKRSNITAIDLISYSPMIEVGDMHAMPYPDASFDVTVVGWVISYSDQKEVAAAEIARVTKRGGIVAIGIEWHRKSPEDLARETTGYIVGSAQRLASAQAILDLFGDKVDRVYASVDDQDIATEEGGDLLVVFRLR